MDGDTCKQGQFSSCGLELVHAGSCLGNNHKYSFTLFLLKVLVVLPSEPLALNGGDSGGLCFCQMVADDEAGMAHLTNKEALSLPSSLPGIKASYKLEVLDVSSCGPLF